MYSITVGNQNSNFPVKDKEAMEHFFQDQNHGDIFWYDDCQETPHPPPPPPVNQSAFLLYKPGTESGSKDVKKGCDSKNSNRRMIEFLRKSWRATAGSPEPERERCQQHMINERMRREREKRCYLALQSLLPSRSKSDKNSIIQTAAKTIQELQCYKRELERKNYELEAKMAMGVVEGGTKIRVSIGNPISGVDSMVEVLKCLKNLGSRTISIQSQFSDQRLTSVIDIETQMGGAEVEDAVKKTLEEVERKLLFNYRES